MKCWRDWRRYLSEVRGCGRLEMLAERARMEEDLAEAVKYLRLAALRRPSGH